MRIHVAVELFRSPNPGEITPKMIWDDVPVTKKGGRLNWTKFKKVIQESIDASEPGRVERIRIQIQG
jgi:hypothetical protein